MSISEDLKHTDEDVFRSNLDRIVNYGPAGARKFNLLVDNIYYQADVIKVRPDSSDTLANDNNYRVCFDITYPKLVEMSNNKAIYAGGRKSRKKNKTHKRRKSRKSSY